MKNVLILVVALVGCVGQQQQAASCESEDDCVLAYTGAQVCGPCDTGHEDYKCVSPEEGDSIQQELWGGKRE